MSSHLPRAIAIFLSWFLLTYLAFLLIFVLLQCLTLLAILPWHLLLYLLYQLFCCSTFYYICYINCFVVAIFITFAMSIVPL